MKLSKTVKEYIHNQIYAKIDESLAELKAKADKAIENFNKDLELASDKIKPILDELKSKYNIDRNYFLDIPLWDFDLIEVKTYHKAYREACSKAERIVTDIMAEVELGGTFKDLKEKINTIKF